MTSIARVVDSFDIKTRGQTYSTPGTIVVPQTGMCLAFFVYKGDFIQIYKIANTHCVNDGFMISFTQ